MKRLRFKMAHGNYRKGDCAGFNDDTAFMLVQQGVAEYADTPAKGDEVPQPKTTTKEEPDVDKMVKPNGVSKASFKKKTVRRKKKATKKADD